VSISASQKATLEAELSDDPLARGYSGMTDAQVLADLNTVYRTRQLNNLSGDDIFAATERSEFAALTDHMQDLWLSFCGRETVDAFVTANVDFVQWVIGTASQTVSNLANLRTEDISRAQELGLPASLTIHQISQAR
jgi:hypothetical protein